MLDYYGSITKSPQEIDKEIIQAFTKKANESYITKLINEMRQEQLILDEYSVSGWMVFFSKDVHEIISKQINLRKQQNEKKLKFVYCYNQLYDDIDICQLICDKL